MKRALAAALLLAAAAACKQKPALEGGAHEMTQADLDRLELTLQPKEPWKPGDAARELRVKLIIENTGLQPGEPVRYRLETQNVGREPVRFQEAAPSFIKAGTLCGTTAFRFLLTPPGGKPEPLACDAASKPAEGGSPLDLTVASGDYLISRPEKPARRFRPLQTAYRFEKAGQYRLQVVYDGDGLKAQSNVAAFSVMKKKQTPAAAKPAKGAKP